MSLYGGHYWKIRVKKKYGAKGKGLKRGPSALGFTRGGYVAGSILCL